MNYNSDMRYIDDDLFWWEDEVEAELSSGITSMPADVEAVTKRSMMRSVINDRGWLERNTTANRGHHRRNHNLHHQHDQQQQQYHTDKGTGPPHFTVLPPPTLTVTPPHTHTHTHTYVHTHTHCWGKKNIFKINFSSSHQLTCLWLKNCKSHNAPPAGQCRLLITLNWNTGEWKVFSAERERQTEEIDWKIMLKLEGC